MTLYFKVIFWNVTKLKVWLYISVIYGYMSLLRTLCYYQEDVGLSVVLYQLNCMKVYCCV